MLPTHCFGVGSASAATGFHPSACFVSACCPFQVRALHGSATCRLHVAIWITNMKRHVPRSMFTFVAVSAVAGNGLWASYSCSFAKNLSDHVLSNRLLLVDTGAVVAFESESGQSSMV